MFDRIAWGLLAAVHLLPALALFRPGTMPALYGVEPAGAAGLLIQHRAALFLAVLAGCVWAAFDARARPLAAAVAAISLLSFLILYARAGSPAGPLRRVAVVDLAALPLLLWVAWRAWGGATAPA